MPSTESSFIVFVVGLNIPALPLPSLSPICSLVVPTLFSKVPASFCIAMFGLVVCNPARAPFKSPFISEAFTTGCIGISKTTASVVKLKSLAFLPPPRLILPLLTAILLLVYSASSLVKSTVVPFLKSS